MNKLPPSYKEDFPPGMLVCLPSKLNSFFEQGFKFGHTYIQESKKYIVAAIVKNWCFMQEYTCEYIEDSEKGVVAALFLDALENAVAHETKISLVAQIAKALSKSEKKMAFMTLKEAMKDPYYKKGFSSGLQKVQFMDSKKDLNFDVYGTESASFASNKAMTIMKALAKPLDNQGLPATIDVDLSSPEPEGADPYERFLKRMKTDGL